MHTREEAYELLKRYNQSESLLRHALAVETVMEHIAHVLGEDADYWGVVGLLHDLDYEMFPDEHCRQTARILRENGYDEAFIHSVMSHGYGLCTDVEPKSTMEKALYAIDELTGLITAAVYMRPSRSVLDLELKSVKKKWKDKSFAAGVNREIILAGCEMLNMELDEVITLTLEGMRKNAECLGLKGTLRA